MEHLGDLERTCYCGAVTESLVGKTITVMGWVDRIRDLGNLVFIDLRDRSGIVQIVNNPESGCLDKARQVRPEFVLAVVGEVVKRSADTVNTEIPTGTVEVRVSEVRILNRAQTPPFPINGDVTASEETRLRYRFLDLRRRPLQENIRLRHRVCLEARRELDSQGFLEIETPFLTKSTPEGARDYLVPSRVQRGHFYALPQSPQLFKQLLMVSGFDRYFQIVRCFRDEDLRADRQPEFTQVDIELSFPRMETVFGLIEGLLVRMFSVAGIQVRTPFPRMCYADAVENYGTDRPDVRYALKLRDVSEAFEQTPFQVFRRIIEEGGVVKGIPVPAGQEFSRKDIDNLTDFVKQYGAGAVSWIRIPSDGGIKSSLPKIVPEGELVRAATLAGLERGRYLLMVAGSRRVAHDALAALRQHLAARLDLIPKDRYDFLWVHDFPLLEWSDEEQRFMALHHPFTSPRDEDLDLLATDPAKVLAKAYDVVLNGLEIGGGSIRIHREDVQRQVFDALRIEREEAEERFGFLLEALRYGAPPHGGIALGLDRIIMLLAGEKSIREVIAFPKTARGIDLMCAAPSTVSEKQLEELHIQLRKF